MRGGKSACASQATKPACLQCGQLIFSEKSSFCCIGRQSRNGKSLGANTAGNKKGPKDREIATARPSEQDALLRNTGKVGA